MRILAIAYACEPDKGSEPGAGWAWGCMLARLGETWVITRVNNRESIEAALPSLPPNERPHFVYVDLPAWARSWKRGMRGVRLYYLLWQIATVRRARWLQRNEPFDVVWHLTLANIWLGSLGSLVGTAFVYGPMGGGSSSTHDPRIVGLKGAGYEVLRSWAVWLGRYLNPSARLSWRRAVLVLANNEATVRWLPARHRHKAEVLPHVAVNVPPPRSIARKPTRVAVFAGRLIPWKGGALAIRAMNYLPDWNLVVFGTGPDEQRLRHMAQLPGTAGRVAFRGWVTRDELLRFMREEADVLLLPSLHDSAPWAVGEALTMGVPAVCLDQGGASALGATCVPLDGVVNTAVSLAEAVRLGPSGPLPRSDIETRYVELRDLLQRRGILPDPAC